MVKIESSLYSDVESIIESDVESKAESDVELTGYSDMNLTVQWPAVIQYQGEDELIYVESLIAWQNDPDLSQVDYETEDRLIDSHGALFSLPTALTLPESKAFIALSSRILVPEFVELVRKHAVIENYCCSAKINANTHQQLISMVKEINSL